MNAFTSSAALNLSARPANFGMNHRAFKGNFNTFRSNTPITDEQIARYAPSIMADQAHESRSERYKFIPTIAVLNGLRAQGFEAFEVKQTKTKTADKREAAKHMIRMRHASQGQLTIEQGEFPEIILLNSHDGTSAYKILSGMFRLVCTNGLIRGDVQNDVSVRHSGNVVDNVIEGSFTVLDNVKEISSQVERFKAIDLSHSEQLALANAAIPLRFDIEEGQRAPVTPEQVARPRRREDTASDLWTVFNSIQENIVRGGLRTNTRDERGHTRTGRSREVTGIDQNTKLNRALWTLAESMAAIKNG